MEDDIGRLDRYALTRRAKSLGLRGYSRLRVGELRDAIRAELDARAPKLVGPLPVLQLPPDIQAEVVARLTPQQVLAFCRAGRAARAVCSPAADPMWRDRVRRDFGVEYPSLAAFNAANNVTAPSWFAVWQMFTPLLGRPPEAMFMRAAEIGFVDMFRAAKIYWETSYYNLGRALGAAIRADQAGVIRQLLEQYSVGAGVFARDVETALFEAGERAQIDTLLAVFATLPERHMRFLPHHIGPLAGGLFLGHRRDPVARVAYRRLVAFARQLAANMRSQPYPQYLLERLRDELPA